MSEKVDIKSLGTRTVTRTVVVSGNPDPTRFRAGTNLIYTTKETVDVPQPLLTQDEANLLKGADWKPSPESMPGTHTCIVEGRRFMAEFDPSYGGAVIDTNKPIFDTEPVFDSRPATKKPAKKKVAKKKR